MANAVVGLSHVLCQKKHGVLSGRRKPSRFILIGSEHLLITSPAHAGVDEELPAETMLVLSLARHGRTTTEATSVVGTGAL